MASRYNYIPTEKRHQLEPDTAMKSLWLEVLRMAMLDAVHDSKGRKSSKKWDGYVSGVATDWIFFGGASFRKVCDMADVWPEQIQKATREAIAGKRSLYVGLPRKLTNARRKRKNGKENT